MTLLIFDCDGVLIDSEPIACRVYAECLAEAGFPVTADEISDRYVGWSSRDIERELEQFHRRRIPDGLPEEIRRRTLDAFTAELRPMPGILEVLTTLPGPRCVASSSHPDRLRHALGLTGLAGFFGADVFSATMVARGKPFPDLPLFAAARMGATPERSLVIEDSSAGVRAGVAAGMRVLGFTGGGHCRAGHGDALIAAGASLVFQDMRDLPDLLRA